MSAPTTSAKRLAEEEGLKLHYYSVIYELIDDVRRAMVGMLKPEFKESDHRAGRSACRYSVRPSSGWWRAAWWWMAWFDATIQSGYCAVTW
jgi:hypothetical protein